MACKRSSVRSRLAPPERPNVHGLRLIFSTFSWYGVIAQLGERLHGMQEVIGSIPISSTRTSQCSWFTVNIFYFQLVWGYSSVGRALAWHARGHRFDPD